MDLYIDFKKTKDVTMWQHEDEFREVETYGEVNRFHTYRSQNSSQTCNSGCSYNVIHNVAILKLEVVKII